MTPQAQYYILLFFSMSMMGWLMEVICKLIEFRRFINRGFLLGPYCPIYGFGAVLITLLLSRHADEPLTVFVLGLVICGTLEYLTSYLMEKLFNARWWDYSHRRFNLNGRVCAGTLIPFGLLGLMLVYFIKPGLFSLFDRIPQAWLNGLCISLCVLLAADTALSANVLGQIRHSVTLSKADNTEELNQRIRATLAQHGVLVRRALRAFPYARLYNNRLKRDWVESATRLREEAKERKKKIRAELERREQKLRDDLNARKKK